MLHCPNESQPSHPLPRFFAPAIVEVHSSCLVREFVEFLPGAANCGYWMSEAFDHGTF
jgi:hypothetical protein